MKKIFCIIIILLFPVNNMASVVSDSDGVAFVTKAEFQDLTEKFSGQILSYNKSIDEKIDGAIQVISQV